MSLSQMAAAHPNMQTSVPGGFADAYLAGGAPPETENIPLPPVEGGRRRRRHPRKQTHRRKRNTRRTTRRR